MSDANADATKTAGDLLVERGSSFQNLFADTAIVGEVHGAVSINFLLDRVRTPKVRWPTGDAQPNRYGRERVIEEVTSVRMSPDAANALALDIILELASLGMSQETLDNNLAIVRSTFEQRVATAMEDKND